MNLDHLNFDNLPDFNYSPEEIAAAQAPEGFQLITSHSAYGCAAGPLFERIYMDNNGQEQWQRAFRVLPKHTNAGAMAHGGLLMTFADILLATAVFRDIPPPFVTVRMTSDFIGRALVGDWVVGEAKIVKRTSSLVFLEGILSVDDKTIFTASGLFRHKGGKKS